MRERSGTTGGVDLTQEVEHSTLAGPETSDSGMFIVIDAKGLWAKIHAERNNERTERDDLHFGECWNFSTELERAYIN